MVHRKRVGKKLQGGTCSNSVNALCTVGTSLLKLHCSKNGLNFLIDSGASCSAVPKSLYKSTTKDGVLQAANGTKIFTYGNINLHLNLGFRRNMYHNFILADVQQPILGADFLEKYNLTLKMNQRIVQDEETGISVKGHKTFSSIYAIREKICPRAEKLLSKFDELTDDYKPSKPANTENRYTHEIVTEGCPPYFRPRKLNPKMLEATKEHFEQLLRDGIVRESISEYASPLHIVPKGSGENRFVGDYRALNKQTVKNRYPLPFINDAINDLQGKNVFSKLDLANAFNQIKMKEEDIKKTAVTTPVGLFEYVYMPYGLCGAAQTFQRFIDKALRGLKRTNLDGSQSDVTYFAYIDDILIASEDENQHERDLLAVLERLNNYNLKLSKHKCEFFQPEMNFVGYTLTNKGIKPMDDKVQAIKNFPRPETHELLKRFLGMVNFYHRFMKNAAEIMSPLNKILKGYTKKSRHRVIQWDKEDELREAFEKTKNALIDATLLYYPNKNNQIGLFTDASLIACGGVLQQQQDSEWVPLGFFSKTFNDKEKAASTFTRELTAIYKALHHFRHLVEGHSFNIYTDHMAIVKAMEKPYERPILKESRMLSFISQFDVNVIHIPGKENQVADILSRPMGNLNSLSLEANIMKEEIVKSQEKCEELKHILNSDSALKLVKIQDLYCNIIGSTIRPFVPLEVRKKIFDAIHNMSHPGVIRSQKLIRERFVWPNIKRDIKNWCQQCNDCQRNKVTKHNKSAVTPIDIETSKFSHIHMDIVGPLPLSDNFAYLLTMIDRFSNWTEAIPLKNIDTKTILDSFLSNWVSRYGVPEAIATDRGGQFTSQAFEEVLRKLGIKHVMTTAYNPKSNAKIERFHRTLKVALRAGPPEHWRYRLPMALLSLRSLYTESIECAPCNIVFGTSLRLPADILTRNQHAEEHQNVYVTELRKAMAQVLPPKATFAPLPSQIDLKLLSCDYVYVRNNAKKGLDSQYLGPFKVLERHEKCFKLQLDKRIDTVAIDRLKSAFIPTANKEHFEISLDFNEAAKTSTTNYNNNVPVETAHNGNQLEHTETGHKRKHSDEPLENILRKPQNISNKKRTVRFECNSQNIRDSFSYTQSGRKSAPPSRFQAN